MQTQEIDARVMEILTTAIDEVGGADTLVEHGEQDVLPTLAESAYALVMREEADQPPESIAAFLGVSLGAVNAIFEAPMEAHLQRIRYSTDERAEFDLHASPEWSDAPTTARLDPPYQIGALAKFAYGVVRRKHGMHT